MQDESAFDVIILGTGLVESITAAALSKIGLRIAHLDENDYYGNNEASLSLAEFITWCKQQPDSSVSTESISQARSYSITLSPSVIPSVGPLISSLVASGVSRYGGFRLVDKVGIYEKTLGVVPVPGSKEDVFKSKSISLVDKRRLMRFLMFASGSFEALPEFEGMGATPFGDFLRDKFSINEDIAKAIAYALAFCDDLSEPTLPTIKRLHRYLLSSGRYGASPFLVGHYGSSGELAQGFCRSAAVSGGVYILGRKIVSITPLDSESRHIVTLDDFPEPISCRILISAAPCACNVARCVAIIDKPLDLGGGNTPSDTNIVVFPPGTVQDGKSDGAITALVVGEGTMSTPQGKWIVYLSAQNTGGSPETLLRPYLEALLKEVIPVFTAFYVHAEKSKGPLPNGGIVSPAIPAGPLPESSDLAVQYAEDVFRTVMAKLGKAVEKFWPPIEEEEEEDDTQ